MDEMQLLPASYHFTGIQGRVVMHYVAVFINNLKRQGTGQLNQILKLHS
jgi:hypothetical protein